MTKKRILLIGGNYTPELTGIGKYNGEMIDWLSAHGYECGVVTTYPYYPYWKIQKPYVGKSFWFKKEKRILADSHPITIYRCPHYVPAIPTGMKRLLSDLSLFLSSFFQVFCLLFGKKYDFVITVAPPFQLGLIGYMYKKFKNAKLVYHIQDLQIDAAQDLGMLKSKFLIRCMFAIERFILRKASFVSSISEGMIRKINEKIKKEILLFLNWADTDFFYPVEDNILFRKKYGFKVNDKIVLYSGAIGEKQGLQTLLATAKDLAYRTDIKFIICGSGPYKERLVNLANDMNLKNVFFMPLQARDDFNGFMNIANVHLVLQKANANDLMLPSKLTTILSVGGIALVTASEGSSLHSLILRHKMGILVEPENQSALTDAIKSALDDSHTETKINARRYAEEFLTIDRIIGRFIKNISTVKKTSTSIHIQKEQLTVDIVS